MDEAPNPAVALAPPEPPCVTHTANVPFIDVLDAFLAVAGVIRAEDLTPQGPHLDRLLERLRQLAAALRLTIDPDPWSFVQPAPVEASAGLLVRPVFRRDVPAGAVVRLKAFGLSDSENVIRPGEMVISAGPPPLGLTDLEALAARAPEPAAAELLSAFAGLRPAGAGGYLEPAAVDLYILYWDRIQSTWGEAAAFGDGLAAMLAASFQLEPFSPQSFRELPEGWILCPPGARMSTGRVTRVLRPGLRMADGQLRLPARVEAE